MVKLLTTELGNAYSSYGARQSSKNQIRGAHLHVAGAFSLLAGFMISLAPHSASWEKESLTLTFFGAALYVVVHWQDVLAIRSVNASSRSRKSKRKLPFASSNASNDYLVAWLYLLGSLSLSAAVAFSNPRWASVLPISGRNQFVFATIAFTFASSLNFIGKTPQASTTRTVDRRSKIHLENLTKVMFISGSNFQLTGSVLQLEQFSSQCGSILRISTAFSCVGIALQLIGGVLNRRNVKEYHLQNSSRARPGHSDREHESESDDDRAAQRRTGKKPRSKGLMGWFNGSRDVQDHSYNSSNHTCSSHEDTASYSGGSFSTDEEAVVLRKGRKRGLHRIR